MGAEPATSTRIRFEDAPSNSGHRRPLGGQHTLTLFGVPGFDFWESALEARASAQQETRVSEREAARRETASRLREFRQALGVKLACAQVQAPSTPVAPERQLFGIARAIAEIPRDSRAARQAACEAVAIRDRERQRELAAKYPAAKAPTTRASACNRPTSPASAFNAPAAGLTHPRRSTAFYEDAAAEYEAHLAEIAEARSHQLDAEADRFACSLAGTGYTEYLMACEG